MPITRDAGVPATVTATNSGTVNTVTSAAITPSTGQALWVCAVAYENFQGTNVTSLTVGWSGGTPTGASGWTRRVEAAAAPGNGFAAIWTATGPNSGVAGTVVATSGSTALNSAFAVSVDVLLGTAGTFGTPASVVHTSSAANSVGLTGVTAGSWSFVANYDEGVACTPTGNTVETNDFSPGNGARAATGRDSTSSGSFTIGWGDLTAFNGVAAIEVLAAAGATPVTGVIVPDSANVGVGRSQPLLAAVQPSNATNQAVTWSIIEGASGTLDNASANPVVYTAPASMGAYPATVHVRATTSDGGFTDDVVVTIPNPVSGAGSWRRAFAGYFDPSQAAGSKLPAPLVKEAMLGAATVSWDHSGTAAALSGAGTLGAPTASRAVSSTASSLAGAGALGAPTSSRAVSSTAGALAGSGAYSTCTGFATLAGEDRTGTATALAGSGTLGTPTASREVSSTAASLTGAASFTTSTGSRAVSSTAAGLTGAGAFSAQLGTRDVQSTAALAGSGAYSSATGTAGTPGTEDRTGTAKDLTAWTNSATTRSSPWLGGAWAGFP